MNKFKKIISIILCIGFLLETIPVYAASNRTGAITTSANFRNKPTTSGSTIYSTLSTGTVFTILDEEDKGNGCNDKWYKISYSDKTGYVCSSYSIELDETHKDASAYIVEEKILKKGPNNSSTTLTEIPTGSSITILGESSSWYYIKYNDQVGFINSNRVTIIPDEDTDEEFKKNVLVNFPTSYHPYLIEMHNDHPNWIFEAFQTGVDFNTALQKESAVGVSLTNSTSQGFYSTAGGAYDYKTDTFYLKEGSSWYAANSQAISYYMDPRTYLNEITIFAFEKLSYDKNLHTEEAVNSTLANFPNLSVYSKDFITAAEETNVSPIHLASRVVQEIGSSTTAISGTTEFTCDGKPQVYSHYYNFFNIGAYTSENPVILGLCYAKNKGWNTPAKAIAGGASTISNGYINAGQDTIYLEKYNVKDGNVVTSHQYMTNIAAPVSESNITYNAYKKAGILDGNFVFKIPVYKEGTLPEKASTLPSPGNPNNYLKTVLINGNILETFNLDETTHTINLPSNAKSVTISGLPVSSKSSVTGGGTIDLTKTQQATLTVKAQNRTTRTYTFNFALVNPASNSVQDIVNNIGVKNDGTYIYGINNKTTTDLIKEITSKNASAKIQFYDSSSKVKTSTSFNTGDTLTISIDSDTKTYKLVVLGDTNGDAKIDILDLLKVQKNILGSSKLTDEYLRAANVNSDEKVDILDLLKVQKNILGQGTIE